MKYKFTGKTKNYFGKILHQIVCVKAFNYIASGELGGWIEKENNLSQKGNAWVYGDARVLLGSFREKEIFVLQIQGSMHQINSPSKGIIKIGCQEHPFDYWLSNFEEIGKLNSYSQEQISEYKMYIDLFINLGV